MTNMPKAIFHLLYILLKSISKFISYFKTYKLKDENKTTYKKNT